MKTGAVIFAAGHKCAASAFKPLMPIGGTTIIGSMRPGSYSSGKIPHAVAGNH